MAVLTLKPFCKNRFSLRLSLSPQELTEIKCEILLVNRSVHHIYCTHKSRPDEGIWAGDLVSTRREIGKDRPLNQPLKNEREEISCILIFKLTQMLNELQTEYKRNSRIRV